jgi:hypothetical protein
MAKKAASKTSSKTAKKARQMAAARVAKGNAEYNQVESKGFDIKLLVAQVAAAQARKTKAQTQVSTAVKKELVADAVMAREEAKAAEEDAANIEKIAHHKTSTTRTLKNRRKVAAPEVNADDATEKTRIFSVVVATKLTAKRLTKDSLEEVETYKQRAKTAILALPAGSNARISLFARYTATVRLAATLKVSPEAVQEKAPEEERPSRGKELQEKFLGAKDRGGLSWKALERSLTAIGKRLKDGASSSVAKSRSITNISPLSSAFTAFAVQSISKIGPGLKQIGKSIKENGTNTLKWVGRKLSDLTRGLMGMFRSAKNMLAANGPEDWAALAAIGVGILPSIVEGLLGELKKRFGEDFVIGFIKEKWESTKNTVTQWLGEFIDKALELIRALPEQIAKGASSLWDKTKEGASSVWNKGTSAVKNLFNTEDSTEVKPLKKSNGASAIDKLGGLLADHSQPGITEARKADVERKIRDLVVSSPSLYNDARIIANLEKRGIKIDTKLSQMTNNTSTTTVNPKSSTSNSTSVSGVAPGSPVSSGGGNAVTTSPPASEASPPPVVAQPPAPEPDAADGSGDAGKTGRQTGGGLNNASVPDNAAPDTLFFMNLASMGAA